ncbi:amidohydrolase family protein [Pigmentiphaga litoralis]|uniref:amidohydrolase family protein n=1 Tax=Pigmentiphaga litoralis TaxID=516702 RepID=UPI003899AD70
MTYQTPPDAWDCHFHVFEHGAATRAAGTGAYQPMEATVQALDAMHARIGIHRGVAVQSTAEVADYDAFGAMLLRNPRLRGVARFTETITERDVEALHASGVRGLRFAFASFMKQQRVPREVFERAVAMVKPFGWHIKVHVEGTDLLELEKWLRAVDAPLVIDHIAHMRPQGGVDQAAMRLLLDLHRRENVWILLCNSDRWSVEGAPDYSDSLEIARAVLHNATERVIWGTDWPHPMYRNPFEPGEPPPDDARLLDFLARAAEQDEQLLQQVLVTNPAKLYT